MAGRLSFDNPVFSNFAFYGGILIGKTVLMSPLTSLFRLSNKTFANKEDLALRGARALRVNFDDQTVERIRRCHLNDIENIVPFTLIGLLYVASGPDAVLARRLFQAFTAARLIHTVVYLCAVPQPCRATAFSVGVCINIAMVVNVVLSGSS